MKNKSYGLIGENMLSAFLHDLSTICGLPEMQKSLSVYMFNDNGQQFHVNFLDKTCSLKFVGDATGSSTDILLKNKNIREIFRIAHNLGFEKASIGSALHLNFPILGNLRLAIIKDSFVGNLFECEHLLDHHTTPKPIKDLMTKYQLTLFGRDKLQKIIDEHSIPLEPLFDKFNCLNSKLVHFAVTQGIDIVSDTKSLRSRIKKFSNDYGLYEETFKQIVGNDLNGADGPSSSEFFKPLSIVVSCFNSNNTLMSLLTSVQHQSISPDQKKLVEVILVDDASNGPVASYIKDRLNTFDFQIKVIRLEKNSGLSTARNVGVSCAKYDHIILLDSDIVLPKNYLVEHSIRNQMIPDAVFISLKRNVEPNSPQVNMNAIVAGLESPVDVDDLRMKRLVKRNQPSVHTFKEEAQLELLNDTNYFKDFGFGRTVGIYDLPAMVIGHNISLRRKVVQRCGGFSNVFSGWGLEDAYFGARAIADGNLVIPIVSCNVFHINHAPRSGSQKQKDLELDKNLKVYQRLLDENYQE